MKTMMITAAAVLCALAAAADSEADSIMFRKKKVPAPVSVPAETAPVPAPAEAAPAPAPAESAPAPAPAPAESAAPGPAQTEATPASAQAEASSVPAAEPAASAPVPDVTVEKKAKDGRKAEKKPKRDAVITAERTDYDRKEGVVMFDRNVSVDDEQYQMHADRLFLFLDGTNDLKRLVAIGHVAITNEDKRAYCARATFNKKLGRVVMYSSDEITAELREEGKKGSDVKGEKITFWLDSEQVEVENPVITMPGGVGGRDGMKKLLGK